METIYENTCTDTQEEYCQLTSWLFSPMGRVLSWVYVVFGALALLASFLPEVDYLLPAIALLLIGVVTLLLPRYHGYRLYRSKVKIYGDALPPKTYLFYEDHFRVFDVDSDATVDYSRIKKIGLLKDCIALMIEPAGAVYTLSRNGFTKGDARQFHMFLQKKCPQCKLPGWQ